MNRKLLSIVVLALVALAVGVTGAGANPVAAARSSGAAGPGAAPQTPLGSGFTYQGRLTQGGSPATGQYDLVFTLFDAATAGVRVGTPITITNQTVTSGLFTVNLDFTPSAFQGSARWLEMAVRQTGAGGYTTLSPRQSLTAAPYALSLMPGAVITGTSSTTLSAINSGGGTGLYGSSDISYGVWGSSGAAAGVYGTSTSGYGLYGSTSSSTNAGVYGINPSGYGVQGVSSSSTKAGVYGGNGSGYGVYGTSTSNHGVYGTTTYPGYAGVAGTGGSGYGVLGGSTYSYGVFGQSINSYGVRGDSTNSHGVFGTTNVAGFAGVAGTGGNGYGVLGGSTNSYGVQGSSTNSDGVFGTSSSSSATSYGVHGSITSPGGAGVYGYGNGVCCGGGGIGVLGRSSYSYGVYGETARCCDAGVYGGSSYPGGGRAGFFQGDVTILGSCCSSPIGIYQIDDPRDPANKYINQAAVESPDMKNVYDGNVTTGADGNAVVTLPGYVGTINHDFRYQLTVIGQFAQAIVSSKVKGNSFTIKTDKPNVEVSWQVTGIRNDPYAQQHPIVTEQDKPASEKGYYQHPELYGQPSTKNVDPNVRNPLPTLPQTTGPSGK